MFGFLFTTSFNSAFFYLFFLYLNLSTVFQFPAHKKVVNGVVVAVELSAMAFDPTLRRLITGSRDGSVKFWNFNNAACLKELEVSHRGMFYGGE